MNHLHNDSNKSSAVNITDDNRDVNDTSVKDTDKISKSSNGNSIKINQEDGMVIPTKSIVKKFQYKE